jgi:formylmethanofuran dehydrogenase subunit B
MAIQLVGESTCSFGEPRNRCDLAIFWGCDPVNLHPRHGERYSMDPAGLFLPRGRADRRVGIIDCRTTDSTRVADCFVPIEKERDFELIWSLRWMLRGGHPSYVQCGVSSDVLEQLGEHRTSQILGYQSCKPPQTLK